MTITHYVTSVFIWLTLMIDNAVCQTENNFPCDTHHIGRSDVIAHQNFPFDYVAKRTCIHHISIPVLPNTTVGWQICFVFHRFSLTSGATCFDDYLEFPDLNKYCNPSNSTADPLSHIFSSDLCWEVKTANNYQLYNSFDVRFHASDWSQTGSGYYAEYTITETETVPRCCTGSDRSCQYCPHGVQYINPSTCPTCCSCVTSVTDAPCRSDQFTCFNRRCIPRNQTCDGIDHCGDGSDEGYWHARCPGSQNVVACSFERDACNFTAVNWTLERSSPIGLQYDNTFKRAYAGQVLKTSYRPNTSAYFNYSAVPIVRASNHCLSFYYFMSGGPVGILNVYVSTAGSTRRIVWHRSAVSAFSRKWLQGEIQLAADKFPLTELTFETVNGSMPENVIGIDDISLLEGNCFGGDISCTFELGYCQWTAELGEWDRSRSLAESFGPRTDHSGNGFYAYTRSTYGETSRLLSRPVSRGTTTDPLCLYFWYQLSAGNLASLIVYIVDSRGQRTALWTASSGLAQIWQQGYIQIPDNSGPFQLVIEANTVSGLGPYVAIDDVLLVPGYCTGPVSKPGQCPPESSEGGIGPCVVDCSTDSMCSGNMKCCRKGCGRTCLDPFRRTRTTPLPATLPPDSNRRCHPDMEYRCKSGECIDASGVCDGYPECADSSDEGPSCKHSPQTGGGLQFHPEGMATASVVGVTLGIVIAVVVIVVISYISIRRRAICRGSPRARRGHGGRASDYFDHCDCSAQPPPPYEFTMPVPPPYSPSKSTDKPPSYELVLMNGGAVCHQPVAASGLPRSSDSEDYIQAGLCVPVESSV